LLGEGSQIVDENGVVIQQGFYDVIDHGCLGVGSKLD
jgi:hypothetical protein